MLDKMPVIQIDCSQQQENRLLVNGQPYNVVTRGFLVKQQYMLDANGKTWLTIRRKGSNTFRLLFANGRKYQLEVLSYTNKTAYVFYDQEDTEVLRLTPLAHSVDTIRLLASINEITEEEFIGLVAWGVYMWRYPQKKNASYKPAA